LLATPAALTRRDGRSRTRRPYGTTSQAEPSEGTLHPRAGTTHRRCRHGSVIDDTLADTLIRRSRRVPVERGRKR
jgi:hypothetical protein